MKKKGLSALLCLSMLVGTMPTVSLAADAFPFTDVAQNDWYRSYVAYTQQENLFNGTSDTTFTPKRDITRAEFVTVLGRMHTQLTGEDLLAKANTFADVSPSKYYAAYLDWAQDNDVVSGFPDGTFHPDEPINREMMAVILNNYSKVLQKIPETTASISYAYEDAASISLWARTSVQEMTQHDLVRGDDTHCFAPKKHTTRAEAAAVFTRLYQGIKYRTEKDVTYSSVRYSYSDDSGKPFLGEAGYQMISDYDTYAELVKAVNTEENTSFQPLTKEYFDTKNVLAVELQHFGAPNYTTKLTEYQENADTASIDLTFFNDGLSGSTADTVGYVFLIEMPNKNIWKTVTIQQADRIFDTIPTT